MWDRYIVVSAKQPLYIDRALRGYMTAHAKMAPYRRDGKNPYTENAKSVAKKYKLKKGMNIPLHKSARNE